MTNTNTTTTEPATTKQRAYVERLLAERTYPEQFVSACITSAGGIEGLTKRQACAAIDYLASRPVRDEALAVVFKVTL